MILEWLPKQILLTGLNSEMINALNSDNHKLSRYITENHTSSFLVNLNKPQAIQRKKDSNSQENGIRAEDFCIFFWI